jgi:hypothetical protein
MYSNKILYLHIITINVRGLNDFDADNIHYKGH